MVDMNNKEREEGEEEFGKLQRQDKKKITIKERNSALTFYEYKHAIIQRHILQHEQNFQ